MIVSTTRLSPPQRAGGDSLSRELSFRKVTNVNYNSDKEEGEPIYDDRADQEDVGNGIGGSSGKDNRGPGEARRRQREKDSSNDDRTSHKVKGKGGTDNDYHMDGKKVGKGEGECKGGPCYKSDKDGKKGGDKDNGRKSGKGKGGPCYKSHKDGKKGDEDQGGIQTNQPSHAPIAGVTPSPTTTALTPEQIACNFLSLTSLAECRARERFDPNAGDFATGSTIPTELGLLTQLTYLDISSNQLSGSIPSSLSTLTHLTYLNVENNTLRGSIPSTYCASTSIV